MDIFISIGKFIGLAAFLFVVYFLYRFYIKPRLLMQYYTKQGVKHSYFEFLVGKYGYYKRSEEQYNDCVYIPKNYLKENPDCKYFMTNLAEYVVISFYDPSLIKEFYSNKDLQKHKFGVEIYHTLFNGFIFNEGKDHARKRKIISQVFHYQLLQNLTPYLSDIIDEFIVDISDTRVEDTIFACQKITSDATTRLFFGNQLVNQNYNGKSIPENMSYTLNELAKLSKTFLYCIFGISILKFGSLKQLKNDSEGLKNFFKQNLLKRIQEANADDLKNKQRKDLIDFLVENKLITPTATENTLTIEEIVEEFLTFYIGGMDTTGHQIGMICYFLCIYPECKEKLLEEIEAYIKSPEDINNETFKSMNYLNAFVTESMRYFTVADQIFVREAKKDVQIGDLKILKGTLLNVGIMENHFNPKYFKDPLEFNPMRWLDGSTSKLEPYVFNPFSSGRANCIGQHFALLEIKIATIKILQKLDLFLDSSYKLKTRYRFIIHPDPPIPITFKRRQK